jgi:hypothetical protein
MKVSPNIHGMQPASVSTEKRQNGMRATPAGSEMNVRTIGSRRVKNTVESPWRWNQRSAVWRWLARIPILRPWRSMMSTRPQ